DNAPETDLTITLNNGEQIVIAAGETSGEVIFPALQGTGELTFSIDGTEGGNYENLDTSSEATTSVSGDSDTSTI
ncbi:immunoglobulin-like domain-containing protein, partial [Vreelandella aquamarina]